MNNSNFFYGSTAKANTQGEVRQFSADDSKPELLLKHYEELKASLPQDLRRKTIVPMYRMWIIQMFTGYNIALRGPMSKYKVLEDFREFLESGELRDLHDPRARERAKIQVVRMHGMDPNSLEAFNNVIFNIVESNKKATAADIEEFVQKCREERNHWVFMIHSYELYLRSAQQVCDIILRLYEMEPNFIHLIISLDQINGSKAIKRMVHNFIYHELGTEFLESYQFEKMASVNIIEDKGDKTQVHDALFHGRMDLQSLIDIHQAVPEACRKIMEYIMKDFIEKKECKLLSEEDRKEATTKNTDYNPIERRMTRSKPSETKPSKKLQQAPSTDLEFERLLDYATANMIVRRQANLKHHLGELADHRVVEYDDAVNKIQCLVKIGTCKKFLEHVCPSND